MKQTKNLKILILLCLTFSVLSSTIVFVSACDPASKLVFSAGAPQVLHAGTISSQITVQLRDSSNDIVNAYWDTTVNLATNASSTGHFYSDQAGQNQITHVTIRAGHSSANFYYKDTLAGHPALTAASAGLTTATSIFTVTFAASGATHFEVSAPTSATAGLAFSLTVTAQDTYGNVVTNYAGTVHFTSSDSQAVLPADSALSNGAATFSLTLQTAGSQTVTVTDTSNSAINGQTNLNITPAGSDHIVISPNDCSITAGDTQTFTVEAFDHYGNSLGDVTDASTFNVNGAPISSNIVSETLVGSYTIAANYGSLTDSTTLTVTGHTVTFTNNGLPSGTTWTITFDNKVYTSTTNTIAITDTSAITYSWSTQTNIQDGTTRYVADQTSGSISVPNQLTQNINYQTQYYIAITSSHGSPTQTSQWVNAGSSLTVSVTSPEGNTAHRWTATGYSIDNDAPNQGTIYTFTNIQSTHTITFNWQEQYYLTVTSPYSSKIGAGWYNAGSMATVSVTSGTVSGSAGTRYVFTNWAGDASGTSATSNSIIMNHAKSATASWKTQYLVTYKTVGNALAINVPANEWVTKGSPAIGTFTQTITNQANDEQCIFINDNRPQPITAPTTITATYQTQYKVTFTQTGIESDAKGTILTIAGDTKDYNQLPNTIWVNNLDKISFTFADGIPSTIANTQYNLESVNATSPITIDQPTAIQATYQPKYSASLFTIAEFALILFALLMLLVILLSYRKIKKNKQDENKPN